HPRWPTRASRHASAPPRAGRCRPPERLLGRGEIMSQRVAVERAAACNRAFKPRAPLTVRSVLVSQLTSEVGIGCNARRYLAEIVPVPEARGCPVARVGKLRLASVDDVERVLLDSKGAAEGNPEPVASDEPTTVAEVLASIGR